MKPELRAALDAAISIADGLVDPPPSRAPAPALMTPGYCPGRGSPIPDIFAAIDSYGTFFRAAVLELRWCEWEPALGAFDLVRINAFLDECAKRGMLGLLWLQTQSYDGSLPLTPVGVTPVPRDSKGLGTPLYDPLVASAYAGSVRRLANELDGRPGFFGMITSETAPGSGFAANDGYSVSGMVSAYRQIMQAMASLKLARGFLCLNSFAGKETTLATTANELGIGIHRTDAMNTAIDTKIPVALHPTPRLVEISLGAFNHGATVESAVQWARDYGANIVILRPFAQMDAVVAELNRSA